MSRPGISQIRKAAMNRTRDKNFKTPYSDLKPKVKQTVTKKLPQLWDENPHNKLFQIQQILKERKLDPNNTRREENILFDNANQTKYVLLPGMLIRFFFVFFFSISTFFWLFNAKSGLYIYIYIYIYIYDL